MITSKNFENWDEYYLTLAYLVAMRSKDNSSWIGAVVVSSENEIISTGYNGFPRGIEYTESRLMRPDKYDYTEHAERNAIFNAARIGVSTKGATMYTHGIPCIECGRAVIQAGIKKIVTTPYGLVASYSDSIPRRKEILEEAGVEWVEIDFDPAGIKIESLMSGELRNGK